MYSVYAEIKIDTVGQTLGGLFAVRYGESYSTSYPRWKVTKDGQYRRRQFETGGRRFADRYFRDRYLDILLMMAVLHFISTPEAAKQDIPLLLQQKKPSNSTDGSIGSQACLKPAEAVFLRLGYTNEVVDEIRQGCADIRPGVPWLTGGLSNGDFEKMDEE